VDLFRGAIFFLFLCVLSLGIMGSHYVTRSWKVAETSKMRFPVMITLLCSKALHSSSLRWFSGQLQRVLSFVDWRKGLHGA